MSNLEIPYFISQKYYLDSRGYSIFNIFPNLSEGQINIGFLNSNIIKGFHYHLLQKDYWHCFQGNIHVICMKPKDYNNFTNEEDYQNKLLGSKEIYHFYIGEKNPGILVIPELFCHGYTNLNSTTTGLLYWVTQKYNNNKPDEYRIPWDISGKELWLPKF